MSQPHKKPTDERWRTPAGCVEILHDLGATPRLVRHGQLVLEAADAVLAEMKRRKLPVDATRVRAGAMLHDSGKAIHPNELDGPGHQHEPAGRTALLALGVTDEVARFCETHPDWTPPDRTPEDLLVALADKLWKGRRQEDLESLVIDWVAEQSGGDRWSVLVELDDVFEAIAAGAQDRLSRS